MDAITNAALDNLLKNALPRLQKALADLHKNPVGARTSNPELISMLEESKELIELLFDWSGNSPKPANAPEDASDAEMMAMMNGLDGMEGTDELSTGVDITNESTAVPETEALGFAGDIPGLEGDMSSGAAVGGDMSDDEARALLDAMDAPVAQAAPGDMSDAEARALLAAMDAPSTAAPSMPPAAAPAAKTLASADDEALAMLAAMGGLEDTTAAPAHVSAPPAAINGSASGELDTTGIDEIPEWENNDFASDPEMMTDFTQNTGEIMQTLDDTVLKLEQNPTDRETIEEIFRAAHTLKGAAGMFGFKSIERVMHRMENLFDLVRKGKLVPNSDTIDVVFQGLDILKKLLAAVLTGKPSGVKTAPIVRMLELAAEGKATGIKKNSGTPTAAPESAPSVQANTVAASLAPTAGGDEHGGHGGGKKKSEAASTIRVDLERLDALVNLVGELVIDRTRFVNIEESLRVQAPQLKLASNMTETLQQFGRHMNEIQEIIMKVRMVPVGSVFNKYPRIVRDLARQLGKQMDLVIEGEETELDKTLVEQIADPLVHLIRNACDHGVEMPADRIATGKKPNGTVILSAKQEGNHILIQISDDGKGMDVNRIKSKAIEKGLITTDQVLSDRDIFNLIFEPGFSTAEKVTTVSGRGVGMDVVRKQIAKLKGTVEITSAPGKGSTISIQLPLTLAIMQSLLVGISEEVYAIPLSSVVESIRIKPGEIQHVGETEVIKLRNTVLPLLYLEDVLDLRKKDTDYWYNHGDVAIAKQTAAKRKVRRKDRLFVVVVGSADRRFGLVVDALLNQQEMVIKPMGPMIRGIPCVAGGAVLGSGEVVLVLDVPEVETFYRTKLRSIHAAIASAS